MEFSFANNATVDSLDKVPEQFRGLYSEADGKYSLAETFKGVAGAVDGLNKSLKAARRDADEAKRNRPDLGVFAPVGQLLGLEGDEATSADALKGAVEALIEKVAKGDAGKINWDKMKRDLEAGHKKALEAKDGELGAMNASLVKYLVTSQAVQAIAANKGVPDLLLPHIAAKTKVAKDGNEYVVRVVDESGDPRGNASGGFMTIEDLVKEMKASPVFGRAFESEAPNGSGVKPGSTSTPPNGGRSNGDLTPVQRIQRGLEKRGR